MAMLSIRDESTGQIKPWVWIAGAGFAIGGAALFLSSGGGGNDTVAPSTSEGLGTGSGLDSLDAALQALLQNLDPGSTGGGGNGGGGGGGGGGGTSPKYDPISGLPYWDPTHPGPGVYASPTQPGVTVIGIGQRPAPGTQPSGSITHIAPTTGSTGIVSGTSGSVRGVPTVTGVTSRVAPGTGTRTAVSTGSINVYPVSKQVNPGPPESVRRNPVAADI